MCVDWDVYIFRLLGQKKNHSEFYKIQSSLPTLSYKTDYFDFLVHQQRQKNALKVK